MKFRNKHYFELSMLPVILLPVIALTVGATLWISSLRIGKYPLTNDAIGLNSPLTDHRKDLFSEAEGSEQFENNDRAVFAFTGDTVLIISHFDSLNNTGDFYKVLYKNLQGSLQTMELPGEELQKIDSETAEADE